VPSKNDIAAVHGRKILLRTHHALSFEPTGFIRPEVIASFSARADFY
jgi:hypothetical protein